MHCDFNSRVLAALYSVDSQIELAISVTVDTQTANVVLRDRLDPNSLPYTAACSVANVVGTQSLLADRNYETVAVGGIEDE